MDQEPGTEQFLASQNDPPPRHENSSHICGTGNDQRSAVQPNLQKHQGQAQQFCRAGIAAGDADPRAVQCFGVLISQVCFVSIKAGGELLLRGSLSRAGPGTAGIQQASEVQTGRPCHVVFSFWGGEAEAIVELFSVYYLHIELRGVEDTPGRGGIAASRKCILSRVSPHTISNTKAPAFSPHTL